MRSLFGAFSLLSVAVLTAPAFADEVRWIEDFDRGLAVAIEQKKDLFVEFTGSDWCPPCKALYREVLSKPAFTEALHEQFVFVKLDFPRGAEVKAKVPNEARNRAVAQEFKIGGYPTILLMTTDKVPYARTVGYGGQGLDGYIEHVKELREKGRAELGEVAEIAKAAESATGDARIGVAERALAVAERLGESPLTDRLLPALRAGMDADADNARGFQTRALRVLFKVGAAGDEDVARAEALDPKNEHGLLEQVVFHHLKQTRSEAAVRTTLEKLDALLAHPLKDDEAAKALLATAVVWCVRIIDDRDRAQRYADALLARFPDDEQLREFVAEQLSTDEDGDENE